MREHPDAANADIAVVFNAFYETDETICRDLLGLSDAGPA